MWHLIAAMALVSGPGGNPPSQQMQLPSQHMLDHQMNSGAQTLSVSGIDGGKTLNRTVYGFLPYWGSDTWLRYDLISVLACFCVDMGSSGTITAWNGFPGLFYEPIDSIHATGGTAVVTVVNFSSSSIHSILTTNRATAISTIVDLVSDHPVDGVSIDFENVSSADRDSLTVFMEELRYQLDLHVPGSHLSICTPAVDWSGAFDYGSLAPVCEALFIMCYPFHGTWSTVAGPCCPLTGWGASSESSSNMVWCLGDYARYAPGQHDKIVVGLPYYGHQWETAGSTPHSQVTGGCSTLLYTTLVDRATTYGRLWDTESLTPWYTFNMGSWYQGWYDDEESLELKYDLIREADLQGAGIWALGYDGSRDELWECLEQSFCEEVWYDSLTDNLESRFTVHGPAQYWRNVTEGGLFYGYFYTYSIASSPDINWAEWTFQFPDSSSSWLLEAWLPSGGNAVVDYRIVHGGTVDTVTVDQGLYSDEWVSLGGPWNADQGLSVVIGDHTGVSGDKIVADAIRFLSPTGISGEGSAGSFETLSLLSGNPAESFVFEIAAPAGGAELSIYDSAGRLVHFRTIGEGDQLQTLRWPETQDVPQGMYTAFLRTDNGCSERKLVLIR